MKINLKLISLNALLFVGLTATTTFTTLATTGCAARQVVVAPIPGQTSTLDGQVYRGLRDIQAVLDTYKARVAAGTFHPTPAMVTAMDQLASAYNGTHSLWAIYHAASAASQASSEATLKGSYDSTQRSYNNALSVGAPLPPSATLGVTP